MLHASAVQYFLPTASRCLSIMAPASSQMLYFSSFKTCEQIKLNKSTGELPALPFICTYVCCIVWLVYGIIVRDAVVVLSNTSGTCMAAYQTYIYYAYAANLRDLQKCIIGSVALIILSILVAIMTPPPVSEKIIGLEGSVMAVLMVATPLSVIKTVVAKRSTEAMPFYPALSAWINGISWTSYGYFVARNPTIYVANAILCMFASVQMLLFAWIYFIPPTEGGEHANTMDLLMQPLIEGGGGSEEEGDGDTSGLDDEEEWHVEAGKPRGRGGSVSSNVTSAKRRASSEVLKHTLHHAGSP